MASTQPSSGGASSSDTTRGPLENRRLPERHQGRCGDTVRHAPPHPPRRSPGGTGQTGPTGIDYLDMVATAHEESAGTGQKIDFAQLAMFCDEHEEQSS